MNTPEFKIVNMIFGSHLYGTHTEKSDRDFKGVYLPSTKDLITLNYRKSLTHNSKSSGDPNRNTADDVDIEFYALQYFIQLCCEGQTTAFDMLHAPDSCILEKHFIWDELIKNRHLFYTNNLTPFIGYAQHQAAKYGIKGSRLNAAMEVRDYLYKKVVEVDFPESIRLGDVWGTIPVGEHSYFLDHKKSPEEKEVLWQICGKKFSKDVKLTYIIFVLEQFINNYGERAKLAAENKGIDWKAMSHALRAAYQVIQLYSEGTITFPLKQAEYLKEVKYGFHHFTKVSEKLEELIAQAKLLASKSLFPEKPDVGFWNAFILFTYHLEDVKNKGH